MFWVLGTVSYEDQGRVKGKREQTNISKVVFDDILVVASLSIGTGCLDDWRDDRDGRDSEQGVHGNEDESKVANGWKKAPKVRIESIESTMERRRGREVRWAMVRDGGVPGDIVPRR